MMPHDGYGICIVYTPVSVFGAGAQMPYSSHPTAIVDHDAFVACGLTYCAPTNVKLYEKKLNKK